MSFYVGMTADDMLSEAVSVLRRGEAKIHENAAAVRKKRKEEAARKKKADDDDWAEFCRFCRESARAEAEEKKKKIDSERR